MTSAAWIDSTVVVVTGAASGLGAACAGAFARGGATVVAADRDGQGLAALAAAAGRDGATVVTVEADVSLRESAAQIVSTALGNGERLDLLVNCAGMLDGIRAVDETPPDLWHRVLAVNLDGPFYLAQAAIPTMLAQGRGTIINVASIAGIRGARSGAAYTASKHGLIGLGRSIAATYADEGIRCVTVVPASVEPVMKVGREPGRTVRVNQDFGWKPPAASAADFAELVVFLASPAAGHITGTEIIFDGGLSGR
jgi:NAD(P)-dependent dehydrogenase (short-subunit alcohol dehydrogenase family)